MPTLLLRLCGPMQSWGTRSRFTERDTWPEPSKSGVIGLICAALGRPRDADVSDLAALRMGVRVDREGTIERDYHTARGLHGILRASGSISKDAVLSNRYYIADADFLVGLEGEPALLEAIEGALQRPHWQLFLGRKAFVPAVPITLPGGGIRSAPLRDALVSEPWPLQPSPWPPPPNPRPLRLVLEAPPGQRGEPRADQPVGAAYRDRSFAQRAILTEFIAPPEAARVP